MQLPLSLLRRGLLGLMDSEERPRGLFSLFDSGSEEDEPRTGDGVDAPLAADGPPQAAGMPRVADDLSQESSLDYWRRQARLALWGFATLGTGGLTKDPVTGEIHYVKNATRVGDRMSEIAQQVPFGPGRAGGPSRPTGPAGVRSQPQAGPGLLFGGPQATTTEDHVYAVGSGGGSKKDKTPDDCEDDYEEDMQECDERFSYRKDAYARCAGRAGIRLGQCGEGIPRRLRMPRWNDAEEDDVHVAGGGKGRKW